MMFLKYWQSVLRENELKRANPGLKGMQISLILMKNKAKQKQTKNFMLNSTDCKIRLKAA